MSISVPSAKYVHDAVIENRVSPFIAGEAVNVVSVDGGTLYGTDHPGTNDIEKYRSDIVTDDVSTLLSVAADFDAPPALATAADQLRFMLRDDGVMLLRVADDAAPGAGEYGIPAGGGTAIAATDVTTEDNVAYAPGATAVSLAQAGDDGLTVLVGDILVFDGDTTEYTVTDDTVTLGALSGTVNFQPPLVVAIADAVDVTISAPTTKKILLGEARRLNSAFEQIARDASEITTSALTAGREYVQACRTFLYSDDAVSVLPL